MALLDQGLPEPNRIFLNYMLVFLKKVSMHADVNMMTSANLGTAIPLIPTLYQKCVFFAFTPIALGAMQASYSARRSSSQRS
jgi:hypothetical protein